MRELPSGVVTFLFSDIEGSTRLLETAGDAAYNDALRQHRALMRDAFARHDGVEVGTEGDSFFVAFGDADQGLAAAVDAQRALVAHDWPRGIVVRVRIGLHTGTPRVEDDDYVGLDVNIAARVSSCAHGGQIICTEATRIAIGDATPQDVGLEDLGEHRLKDLSNPVGLLQVRHPTLPARFPPLRSSTIGPNNLPHQVSSFVGRTRELAQVQAALHDGRLVTLTGLGGAGKTRLAIEAATAIAGRLDGTWLIELAHFGDPGLLAVTVAHVIGAPVQPGEDPIEAVCASIGSRNVLLILDNAEHLIEAVAAFVQRLLGATERSRALVTSREALGVGGEIILATPTLPLPDQGGALLDSEAARLFYERALAASPEFSLEGHEHEVEQICRRLDGIPLALELAAARLRVLGIDQIAQRIDDRFRILAANTRSRVSRHRTLRAAIDWSFDLLSEEEQTFALSLSVFPGGVSLETGEAIAGDNAIELLGSLVAKSLVQFDSIRGRYTMLETIRDYLIERLDDANESRRQLVEVVADLHDAWHNSVNTAREAAVLARLEAEIDNQRAAADWAHATRHPRAAAILRTLTIFLIARGHREEAEHRAMAMLEVAEPDNLAALIAARNLLTSLHLQRADVDGARPHSTHAMELARRSGKPAVEAGAIQFHAHVLRLSGDLRGAVRLLEDMLERNLLDDPSALARAIVAVGDLCLMMGDLDAAEGWYERGRAHIPDGADRVEMSYSDSFARLAIRRGDIAGAEHHARVCLTTAQALGDWEHELFGNIGLGLVAYMRGDREELRARFDVLCAAFRGRGQNTQMFDALIIGAIVARLEGGSTTVAEMLGGASAVRERAPGLISYVERDTFEELESHARETLSASTYEDSFAQGASDPAKALLRLGSEIVR